MIDLQATLKYKKSRRLITLLLSALFLLNLTACSSRSSMTTSSSTGITVYYLNSSENGLNSEALPSSQNSEALSVDSCLSILQSDGTVSGDKSVFIENVTLLDKTLEDSHLMLNFSSDYYKLSPTKEVLVRAGIVRTLVQLDDVYDVSFTVEGSYLTTGTGSTVGAMTENSFIENSGRQINSLQHSTINLYFADENGTQLRRESRSIYYSANKPLEWAIVERIIDGPKADGCYATVPGNTQIINISTADDICYVNLSRTFLTDALLIDAQLPIYSIVNSLVENCGISSVHISIEGDTDAVFRETIDLSNSFSENLSLVEEAPTPESIGTEDPDSSSVPDVEEPANANS